MRLRVLFFGILRERFGLEEELQQFPGHTVADVLGYYRAVSPELQQIWQTVAVAVNQEYAPGKSAIHEGDEIALLPPVSGGAEGETAACKSN